MNLQKLFFVFLLIVVFTTNTFSQETATATATATIIAPITITNAVDMNFGNVAIQAETAGTAVIAPAGTRTSTGGVTLPSTTGTVTAASFTIGGEGIYTYTITIPSTDYTITDLNSAESMIVNTFTSTPSGTGILADGAQTLNVGATLNVSAAQTPGVYTNATGFNVTVNYN
jgi:general stress protein CsbA